MNRLLRLVITPQLHQGVSHHALIPGIARILPVILLADGVGAGELVLSHGDPGGDPQGLAIIRIEVPRQLQRLPGFLVVGRVARFAGAPGQTHRERVVALQIRGPALDRRASSVDLTLGGAG